MVCSLWNKGVIMPNNPLYPATTKGDIVTFDGSSRIRVAVGTSGQALRASSSASGGIAWLQQATTTSDSYALISSTSLSTTATTISISGLSSYTDITNGTKQFVGFVITGKVKSTSSGSTNNLYFYINSDSATTATTYNSLSIEVTPRTDATTASTNGIRDTWYAGNSANGMICATSDTDLFTANNFSQFIMKVYGPFSDPASNQAAPSITVESSRIFDDNVGVIEHGQIKKSVFTYNSNSLPLNSITFVQTDPTRPFASGCEIRIYGIRKYGA